MRRQIGYYDMHTQVQKKQRRGLPPRCFQSAVNNGPHNTRNTPTGSAPLPRSAPLQPDQLASPARPHADHAGWSCSPGAMGVSATAEATTIDITSLEGYVTAPRRHSVPHAAIMGESLQGMSQRGMH
ncbi:hypothetical protein WJX84_012383 [Apatococcus fuscideae]|uniref:Uncharacterized protein n=1 Tax=Apatococcus fuscideae TaxID=2026836 RepID=A0AAW1TM95_9CHLO